MPSRGEAAVRGETPCHTGWVGRCYFRLAEHLYTSWAWAFDPLTTIASFGAFPRWRRAALPLLTGRDILEVGHGSGELLVELTRAGLASVGLDNSAPMHRLAGRRLARAGITVPRVMGDARALPFKAGTFDTVVATFPTDFARCPEALAGFSRVLRRGRSPAVILVGPYLDSTWSPFRALLRALLGTSPEDLLHQHVEASEAAGFQMEVNYMSGRLLRVPILVASEASTTDSSTTRFHATPTRREDLRCTRRMRVRARKGKVQ